MSSSNDLPSSHPSTTSSSASAAAFTSFSTTMFNSRAPTYDAANGGWHAELAQDFVDWWVASTTGPSGGGGGGGGHLPAGAPVLDLACGTGLVTIPAARAVGKGGVVVGVDISSGMLAQARRKVAAAEEGEEEVPPGTTSGAASAASIEWIKHDVSAGLEQIPAVRHVLNGERGGFDVIFCCSALVLLPDPPAAIKHWATLLKPGTGKLIVDVPVESPTLQRLFTMQLRHAIGRPTPHDLRWVRDVHSLDELFQAAGLQVEKSFRTRSYIPVRAMERQDRDRVFEEQTTNVYKGLREDEDVLALAREKWRDVWDENQDRDGRVWEMHPLYVTIGRRV